jgi:hypothetical protein
MSASHDATEEPIVMVAHAEVSVIHVGSAHKVPSGN